MTYPVGEPDDDAAYRWGSGFGFDMTEDTAISIMTGGISLAMGRARSNFVDHVEDPLSTKPSLSQIPVGSPLWQTILANEDSTFPRSQLTYGAASATSSGGSGDSSHTHRMGATPQYKPAGNGGNTLEIAYISAAKNRTYTEVGFITGDAVTFLGIQKFVIGVFSVNRTTGALTLLNPISAAVDLKGSMTATNTEYRFNLGTVITAAQNDIFGVGLLQVTNAFQTCSSLMCTTLTDLNPPVTMFPRKNYCYFGSTTTIPSTITESSLNYGSSDKLPFLVLR
ncbi:MULTISPECIES: hypothetical protein [Nocardia]|uniref:hypothetical protein n=1 Tax=Nocardia TaxID=1817 RepID=UPI000D687758|nr:MULTISPECIES: hypothetical protein [Nocardia]